MTRSHEHGNLQKEAPHASSSNATCDFHLRRVKLVFTNECLVQKVLHATIAASRVPVAYRRSELHGASGAQCQ